MGGLASLVGAADTGEDRGDDLVAKREQGGDGAGGVAGHVVAAGAAGFDDEVFAAELAEVVGGLAGGVVGRADGVDLGGEVGDGEPVGCDGQREHGGQGRAGAGFVEVDAADAGGADLRRVGQLVEDAVGDEADVDAVQGGAEPFEHAGEPGDDLGEPVQDAADAEGFGVVDDRFEAQHVFAFGVALQRQARSGP